MTWTETHERSRIIREVVAAAEADPTGAVPWRKEYAVLFGDRDGLVAALRRRWQLTCEAQLDPDLTDDQRQDAHRRLLAANAGVLRMLDHQVARGGPAETVSPVA